MCDNTWVARAFYGVGFYFVLPRIFMVEDSLNILFLLCIFALTVPLVHAYLLKHHNNFVKSYLEAKNLVVVAYGIPL